LKGDKNAPHQQRKREHGQVNADHDSFSSKTGSVAEALALAHSLMVCTKIL